NNADLLDLAILYLGMNIPKGGVLLLGMNKFAPLRSEDGQILNFGRIKLNIEKIEKFIYDHNGFREEIFEKEKVLEFNQKIFNEIEKLKNIIRDF
ncbi:MAG: hypothetical protein ACTSVV_18910, partial [Promethearchaeota archaeon]